MKTESAAKPRDQTKEKKNPQRTLNANVVFTCEKSQTTPSTVDDKVDQATDGIEDGTGE